MNFCAFDQWLDHRTSHVARLTSDETIFMFPWIVYPLFIMNPLDFSTNRLVGSQLRTDPIREKRCTVNLITCITKFRFIDAVSTSQCQVCRWLFGKENFHSKERKERIKGREKERGRGWTETGRRIRKGQSSEQNGSLNYARRLMCNLVRRPTVLFDWNRNDNYQARILRRQLIINN